MTNNRRYTVEKQGGQWIASDGIRHVEADDPEEAFFLLIGSQLDSEFLGASLEESTTEHRAVEVEMAIYKRASLLIVLAAKNSPASILRNEVAMLSREIEKLIALRGEE